MSWRACELSRPSITVCITLVAGFYSKLGDAGHTAGVWVHTRLKKSARRRHVSIGIYVFLRV